MNNHTDPYGPLYPIFWARGVSGGFFVQVCPHPLLFLKGYARGTYAPCCDIMDRGTSVFGGSPMLRVGRRDVPRSRALRDPRRIPRPLPSTDTDKARALLRQLEALTPPPPPPPLPPPPVAHDDRIREPYAALWAQVARANGDTHLGPATKVRAIAQCVEEIYAKYGLSADEAPRVEPRYAARMTLPNGNVVVAPAVALMPASVQLKERCPERYRLAVSAWNAALECFVGHVEEGNGGGTLIPAHSGNAHAATRWAKNKSPEELMAHILEYDPERVAHRGRPC